MARQKPQNPIEIPLFSGIESIRRRARMFGAAGVLLLLAVAAWLIWGQVQSRIGAEPQYRVAAENITTPSTPPWIRSDVRAEALREAGLHGDLSVLDPPKKLQARLADAFRFHPWVRTVDQITKRPPNKIDIVLTYRRPLAAVQMADDLQNLLLVDPEGIRLPERDLTYAELRYLPRVVGIVGKPLPGESWGDPRVLGAVELVGRLGEYWVNLRLADIVPGRLPEVHGPNRFYTYELVTTGGTRIRWGTAPSASPAGEASFDQKLGTLVEYVRSEGPLKTVETPAVIDVRNGLQIEQRRVQLPDDADEVIK